MGIEKYRYQKFVVLALTRVEFFQRYFSLDMCADEVFSNAASKMAQTTLDSFLA